MANFSQHFLFPKSPEKATSEKNTTEQWDVIMNICDNIGNSGKHAKDCIRSIIKRLNNPDPHVVIQAITVSATNQFAVYLLFLTLPILVTRRMHQQLWQKFSSRNSIERF